MDITFKFDIHIDQYKTCGNVIIPWASQLTWIVYIFFCSSAYNFCSIFNVHLKLTSWQVCERRKTELFRPPHLFLRRWCVLLRFLHEIGALLDVEVLVADRPVLGRLIGGLAVLVKKTLLDHFFLQSRLENDGQSSHENWHTEGRWLIKTWQSI